jgi:hypothetical protein
VHPARLAFLLDILKPAVDNRVERVELALDPPGTIVASPAAPIAAVALSRPPVASRPPLAPIVAIAVLRGAAGIRRTSVLRPPIATGARRRLPWRAIARAAMTRPARSAIGIARGSGCLACWIGGSRD